MTRGGRREFGCGARSGRSDYPLLLRGGRGSQGRESTVLARGRLGRRPKRLAHERKCTIADLRVGDATEGELGNAKYEDENVGDVLALRAIAGQLQVLGYQNCAVPGGVQASLGI